MDKILDSETMKKIKDDEFRSAKAKVIKHMMFHRTKVALKMSTIANELVKRGRRHDNSYSSDTEISLAVKAQDMSLSKEDREYNKGLLVHIHGTFNDYSPLYFEQGLRNMNLIQLIEYIADKMAEYEEEYPHQEGDEYIPEIPAREYFDYVVKDLGNIPTILVELIENTISWMIDNIKYTKAMLLKKGMEVDDYVKVKKE